MIMPGDAPSSSLGGRIPTHVMGQEAGVRIRPLLLFALFLLVLMALGLSAWFLLRGSQHRSEPLGVIAPAPDFSLAERSGRTVSLTDLRGRIWVVDFFFTSCTGPCPEMSLRMRSLQRAVMDEGLDVLLVSVSLDPEIDRPAVLKRYAEKYGADPDRWLFLTGDDQERVHELVKTGFLQAVERATHETPLIHSTYLLLIDAKGRIRAVYDGLDPSSKRKVLRDIRWLIGEFDST